MPWGKGRKAEELGVPRVSEWRFPLQGGWPEKVSLSRWHLLVTRWGQCSRLKDNRRGLSRFREEGGGESE